jgi:Carboxypeptidase regulatory-like domain
MTRRQIVTALLFIAAGSSVGAAASQKPAVEEPGAIRGVVTRVGTAEPLNGAQVTLQGGAANPQALQVLLNTAASQGIVVKPEPGASTSQIIQALSNAAIARGFPLTTANLYTQLASLSGKTPPTTTTDRDGRFLFKDVSPGNYTVRVQKEGFFGKSEGGANPPTAATDVEVDAGKTAEADLAMIPGAIVGGRIFDEKGQLMSNAVVQAFTVAYAFGRATLAPQVSKVTDDRGEFRLFWVPPGEYYLAVTPAPVAPAPGVPAAASPLKTYYPGVTDIALAKTVTITGGEDMGGMDIPLRGIRSFKVSGQVNSLIAPPPTQLGAPGVNAAVLFMLNRDEVAPDDANGRQVGVVPLIPSTGQFEISNIMPGVYELLARVADPAAQVAGGLPLAWGRARFEVRDMDVANLAIVVSPSSEVTGTLVATEGAKVPASMRVQLLPDDASIRIPAFQLVLTRSAIVGPDGTFKIPAVPEGHYRVMTVAGLPPDLYLADVRHKAMSVFNAGFDVRSGENDPIQVLVGSGAGTVGGVVQDGPVKVVAGATVALVPEAARRGNLALYVSAVTDAAGRFVMRGVPPGDYKLFAWESVRPFAYQNGAFIAKNENRGRVVHVGQGNTVNAELTIIRD